MKIKIDGETFSIEERLSLKEVLNTFGYGEAKVAVALNDEFVPKALHGEVMIQADDNIHIIVPMQGG